ncbi:hypothetical protein [Clostridium perfringens]|uniref:hypothetical protein n=1 Tax=Clostridium perfringens TaxID=1502 RepID=UPI0024BD0F12|nr:hypothetical protein [Clostridium perfringens]
MKQLYKQIISLSLSLALIVPLFSVDVFANELTPLNLNNKDGKIEIKLDKDGNPTEETINEVSDMLEFIVEDALVLDDYGSVLDVDINKIRVKYGNSSDLEKLDEIIHGNNKSFYGAMPNNAFADCMIEAIKDYFGIGLIGIITSGTVYKLITKKAWKEVAKILVKNIAKVAGRYVGVASIVATLIYYSGKCAYTSYVYADEPNVMVS